MPMDHRHEAFVADFNELRLKHFPDATQPVGLHRVDICNRTGAFGVLADETRRRAFDAHLLKLLEASHYLAFGVTIDKAAHASAKHRRVSDSYHYCMLATLERFCGRLAYRNNVGDVMVEQRGKKEDQALKAEFRRLVERREGFLRDSASRLTSNEIKLKPKSADVPGLQLADLVAREIQRDTLHRHGRGDEPRGFGAEVIQVLQRKYNKHEVTGKIDGYGRVLLT